MQNNIGTPKNLDQAIESAICIGPMNEIKERAYFVMKDYMAQKFTIAYCKMDKWRDGSSTMYSPEEILRELYAQLTERNL